MSEFSFNILAFDCGALRPDLTTSRQVTAQGKRVIVRNPETGKTFLFSEGAFRVLESLQPGKPARNSIAAAFAEGLERSPATAQLVAQAHAAALLIGGEVPAIEQKPSGIVNRATRWNPLYIRIPILDPQPLVRVLRPVARVLFHPWTFRLWALALIFVGAAVATSWKRYGWELIIFRNFAWWPVLYSALAVSAVIHELSHVMMCDRYGVAVKQVGILFYFLNPGAYADVSAAWMLPERTKRVAIALAGLYVESMFLIFITAFWLVTKFGAFHEIAFVLGLCLFVRIVLNLIPFLRLDGYWALADTIGMPNLRSSAFRYLTSRIPGFNPRQELRPRLSTKHAAILLTYGIAALAFLGLALALMVRNIFDLAAKLWPHHAAAGYWVSASILLGLLIIAGLNVAARAGAWQPRNN
ncbi:MAG TPA: site-2 protease family protein [Bryobacteraceae bacterium]|jgi:putative peptide zinc metalloprotease protein|nr:site-2 protease family protein [Bryobacteraceae bacterium]